MQTGPVNIVHSRLTWLTLPLAAQPKQDHIAIQDARADRLARDPGTIEREPCCKDL
jgi:hypothetical protein